MEEAKEVKRENAPKRWPNDKTKNLVGTREIIRDWKPWSWKYKWPDRLAVKKGLTEKQKAFVDEYLQSHNATAAYRAAKGTLGNREEWIDSDRPNWMQMKKVEKVKEYLIQKLAEKEESTDFTGIWEVTITIKHKQPEIIEGEVLNAEDINDAKATSD